MLPAVLLPLPEEGHHKLDKVQREAVRMTGETWGCLIQKRGMKEAYEIINWRCLCLFCKSLNEVRRGRLKYQAVVSQPSSLKDVAHAYGLHGLKKATKYIYGRKRWEDVRKFTG